MNKFDYLNHLIWQHYNNPHGFPPSYVDSGHYYVYDAFGRRVGAFDFYYGDERKSRVFSYSGDHCIWQISLVSYYYHYYHYCRGVQYNFFGIGTDEVIAVAAAAVGDEDYEYEVYHHMDGRGNVVAISDSADNAVRSRYFYDVFGECYPLPIFEDLPTGTWDEVTYYPSLNITVFKTNYENMFLDPYYGWPYVLVEVDTSISVVGKKLLFSRGKPPVWEGDWTFAWLWVEGDCSGMTAAGKEWKLWSYLQEPQEPVLGEWWPRSHFYFQGRPAMWEVGRGVGHWLALYDFRARTYDPIHGRFLSRDPIGYADSLNLYSFVNNNPMNFVDPYGLSLTFDVKGEVSLPIESIKGFFAKLPVVGSSLSSAIDSVTEHVPDEIGYKIKMDTGNLSNLEFELEVKWIKGVGAAKREIGISIKYLAATGEFEVKGSYEFKWGPPEVLGFELSATGSAAFTVGSSDDAVFSLAGKVDIKSPEVNLPLIGPVVGRFNWEGKITIITLGVKSGDIAVLDVDLDPIVDPGPAWQGNLYKLIGIQNPFREN